MEKKNWHDGTKRSLISWLADFTRQLTSMQFELSEMGVFYKIPKRPCYVYFQENFGAGIGYRLISMHGRDRCNETTIFFVSTTEVYSSSILKGPTS